MDTQQKNRRLSQYLIANAKSRLMIERAKQHDIQRRKQAESQPENRIDFFPLAAKATRLDSSEPILSKTKDYNFEMSFQSTDNYTCCTIQAKGYSAIEAIANRTFSLQFESASSYLIQFNQSGTGSVSLPLNSEDGRAWHLLNATITPIM